MLRTNSQPANSIFSTPTRNSSHEQKEIMNYKFSLIISIVAISVPVLGLQARQTDSPGSSTEPRSTAAETSAVTSARVVTSPATKSSPSSSSSASAIHEETCAEAASTVYETFPEKPEQLSKASESYYASKTKESQDPTPACGFIESLGKDMIDPLVNWMIEVNEWADISVNKDRLVFMLDHGCATDENGEAEAPEECRDEAVALAEKYGISEKDFVDRISEGGAGHMVSFLRHWAAMWVTLNMWLRL